MTRNFIQILSAFLLLLLPGISNGQTLVEYTGSTTASTAPPSGITATALSFNKITSISAGSGCNGSNRFNAANFVGTSTANYPYAEFTLTATSTAFTVDSINMTGCRKTASGPSNGIIEYTANGGQAVTSAPVTFVNTCGATTLSATPAISVPAGNTIKVRVYIYYASGSGGNLDFTAINVIGSNVVARPVKLAITSISPATPMAGSLFNVTIQAQDTGNAPVAVRAATGITLTSNGNAGAIGGNTAGTISNGSSAVTITGVSLPAAGTGVTLTATRNSGDTLIAATSAPFSVAAPQPEINVVQNTTTYLSGSSYSFGNVTAGNTASTVFTVQNTGAANLTVNNISSNNGNFAVTALPALPATISGPSGTATFQVNFNPTGTGAANGVITILNDDADESIYTINVGGTGIASATSNIIADAAFSYAQNIDYTQYQSAAATNTNSIGAFRMQLQDGGNAFNDGDTLPTQLTALSLSYSGTANTIRSAALYNGSTWIANATIGANSISFAGLSGVSAPDNSSLALTLYVTYNTTVTDNQQLQFTVNSVTAGAAATSSQFAAANGGSAQSSVAANNNRIAVTANHLVFSVSPATTVINAGMSPAPVVSAADINNNIDLDFAGAVSITSSGSLNNTPVVNTAANGSVSFSGLIHSATDTGIVLTAQTTGLASATSSTFKIIPLPAAPANSYRTAGVGTWSNGGGTAIWEQLQSGVWTSVPAPTFASANNSNQNVYIRHAVSISGSASVSNIVIDSGATFTVSSAATISTLLKVENGGTLQVNAAITISSGSTFDIEDGGTAVFNYSSFSGSAAIFGGKETFHPLSNVRISQFSGGGTPLLTNIFMNDYNGYTAAFGNLIFDFTADPGTSVDLLPTGAYTGNIAHNNLRFVTSSTNRTIRIATSGVTTSGIGGDFIIESTYGTAGINIKSSGTSTFTVGGNFNLRGGALRLFPSSIANSTSVVNVKNLVMTNSASLDMMGSIAASQSSVLNVSGNISIAATATFMNSNTKSMAQLNFNGNNQSVSLLKTDNYANINFNINNNSTVQLLNNLTLSNLTLTSGIFNLGSYALTIAAPVTADLTNGTVSGGSAGSYVQGNLIRLTNSITPYAFPVGKSGYAPVTIQPSATGANTFSVVPNSDFKQTPSYTSVSGVLSAVNATEWYDIAHPSGTATATITLPWGAASGVTNPANIVIAHFNSALNVWESLGGTSSGTTSGGTVTVAGVSSFSPFAIGSINGTQPLPVHIGSFTAKRSGSSALLNWELLTADGNESVAVERSTDGQHFTVLNNQSVPKCNGIRQSYQDNTPERGASYYRIVVTNGSGEQLYSVIRMITFEEAENLLVYPNPVTSTLSVSWGSTSPAVVEVRNMNGLLVWKQSFTGTPQAAIPVAAFKDGFYFITLQQGGRISTRQVQVQH